VGHLNPGTWWPLPILNLASSFIPGFKELTGIQTQSQRTGHPEELHSTLRFGIRNLVGEWAIPRAWQPHGGKLMPSEFELIQRRNRLQIQARRQQILQQRGPAFSGGPAGTNIASTTRIQTQARQLAVTQLAPLVPARAPTGAGVGLFPGLVATRTWTTFPGGPMFTRFDGPGGTRISVTRKDGTIKTYRPHRPVVIPRKWNSRSMGRVATALKSQQKMAIKIVQLAGGEATAGKRAKQPTHAQILEAAKK